MAMMAKMRDLAPVFIISVGVIFVLFMVISDSNVLEALGGGTNVIGSVNGEDITYQEFNDFVERARENQEQQTGQEIPQEQMEQFRDNVWDAMVTQILTDQKMEEYGITVTDQEVSDVLTGENPPEFLKQYFVDSTGQFRRDLYENFLYVTAQQDAQANEFLLQVEDAIRQQLYQQKLQSILFASVTVSEAEVQRRFIDQNIKMTAQYALLDFGAIPDSVVSLTEAELKEYYSENANDYMREDQRVLKYVMFPIKPSAADTGGVLKNLESILDYVNRDTSSFKSAVEIYSEQPYSLDTVSISQLPADLVDSAMTRGIGAVVGPLPDAGGYAIYHIVDMFSGGDELVRASHILIASTEDPAADSVQAFKVYNELIAGADFEQKAKEVSKDPGSAANGGDLGWFGRGRMVKEFEEACFNGSVGVIQKPVKTSFGWHIIKVTGRSNQKMVVEKIVNEVKPSALTYNDISNEAADFAYLCDKQGFETTVEEFNYTVRRTAPFNEEVFAVPGIGYNRALITFAFENSLGDLSPVLKVPNGYVVARIDSVIKAGVKPFEEVENQVKNALLKKHKLDMAYEMMKDVRSKIDSSLLDANKFNKQVKVNTAGNFSTSGSIPTIGVDYAFSVKAYDMQLNTISEPFKGQRGVYIIDVTQRNDFDSTAFELQKNSIRDQIMQERKNNFYNQWLEQIKEQAEIVDNRHNVYQ